MSDSNYVHIDDKYKAAMQYVLDNGEWVETRTGVECLTVFGGVQIVHDVEHEGFPLISLKKTPIKLVMGELLWFLSGSSDNASLARFSEQNEADTIWYENIKANGGPGNLYGHQWRNWNDSVDQIKNIVDQLKNSRSSRQIMLTSFNPSDTPNAALPPCHVMVHFRVLDGRLNAHVFQRSCDMFLGVPFNLASYAALMKILCLVVGDIKVGKLVWTGSDVHIYSNHMRGVHEMMRRKSTKNFTTFDMPKPESQRLHVSSITDEIANIKGVQEARGEPFDEAAAYSLARARIKNPHMQVRDNISDIKELKFDTFTASNFGVRYYHPLPTIKAPMAV